MAARACAWPRNPGLLHHIRRPARPGHPAHHPDRSQAGEPGRQADRDPVHRGALRRRGRPPGHPCPEKLAPPKEAEQVLREGSLFAKKQDAPPPGALLGAQMANAPLPKPLEKPLAGPSSPSRSSRVRAAPAPRSCPRSRPRTSCWPALSMRRRRPAASAARVWISRARSSWAGRPKSRIPALRGGRWRGPPGGELADPRFAQRRG